MFNVVNGVNYVYNTNFTMGDDFKIFLEVKKGYSSNTIDTYLSITKGLNTFFNGNTPSINLVEKYLHIQRGKYSPGTYNIVLSAVKCLQEYYDYRGMEYVVWGGYRFLKPNRKVIDVITPDEIKKIINTKLTRKSTGNDIPSDTYYIMFTKLLAYTGARFSEIAHLRVKEVFADYLLLTGTKNKTDRKAYIPPHLRQEIDEWVKDKNLGDLVVTNTRGQKMHAGDFLLNLRKRFKAAGVNKKAYPHVFRHSFATQLILDGVDAMEVKEIIGHKSIESTVRYVHLADQRIKRATFKHTLFREQVSAVNILSDVRAAVKSFSLDTDDRFQIAIVDKSDELGVNIKIR